MIKIVFNTIKIQGFGSIAGYKVFKLNDPGLTIIRGKNGAGKSTIFSALAWCLYGKTLKPNSTIETWEHKRSSSWAGTIVSVSLYIGDTKFKVTRCKNYQRKVGTTKGGNRLIVEEAGAIVDLKDKRDIQKYIESKLGLSFGLFTTAIVFSQKGDRFIELPGPMKKEILEESFKISWLSKAQELAKKKRKDLEKPQAVLEGKIESYKSSLDSIQNMLDSVEESRLDFIKTKEKKLTQIREKIKEYSLIKPVKGMESLIEKERIARNKLDVAREALKKFEAKNTGLKSREVSLSVELNTILRRLELKKKELFSFTEKGSKNCPVCGQPISQHKAGELSKEIEETIASLKGERDLVEKDLLSLKELTDTLKNLEASVKEARVEWENINSSLIQAREMNLAYEKAKSAIDELKAQKTSIEEETFKDPSKPLLIEQQKIKEDKIKYQKQLLRVNREIQLLDWAIRGPLGNNGIKTYLFSLLLERLNKTLSNYARYTGIEIELIVDDSGARKSVEAIVYKDGAPIDYRDLSGGEAQIVNGIISIASGEVLLSDLSINLRVFDEIELFLDPDNMAIISNILSDLSKSKNVYVITHSNHLDIAGANEILLGDE